ncbi:MAG: hypothetical protein CMB45_06255 [Euryarchaeota archaeon]|nr:hypothetical protein [Euryarchaeota archaeon]|tara:strand:- start:296 stop:982 length:687 start_codon:yes stop_codon:yes gene_type:complete
MEDIGKIFRNLGNNFGPKEENSERVAALESKINDIQSEMYGTIEALVARVRSLEQQVAELRVEFAEAPSSEYTNAFDLMTPEELLGRKAEPIDPLHIDDVTSVKGFVAPPPVKEEEVEEEIDLPDDEPLSGVETIDLDMYELLGDDEPNDLDASEIITYIESYGGVLNQEMKKKELLREGISDSDRKKVYALLEKCGIKTYKANKFRTFFYIGSETDGEKKYKEYMAK